MPLYRCCFLAGDRIVSVEERDHPGDAKAIDWARDLHRQYPQYPAVEVWQGTRLVDRHDG